MTWRIWNQMLGNGMEQHCSKLDPKAEIHTFFGVAEHAKAWKYFNKNSRHVQISRDITFDKNDTKIIPNSQWGWWRWVDGIAQGGESLRQVYARNDSKRSIYSTDITQFISKSIYMPTPIPELCWSTQITNKPDYWLLNSGSIDRVLISHEIITEPNNYTEAIAWDDSRLQGIHHTLPIDPAQTPSSNPTRLYHSSPLFPVMGLVQGKTSEILLPLTHCCCDIIYFGTTDDLLLSQQTLVDNVHWWTFLLFFYMTQCFSHMTHSILILASSFLPFLFMFPNWSFIHSLTLSGTRLCSTSAPGPFLFCLFFVP